MRSFLKFSGFFEGHNTREGDVHAQVHKGQGLLQCARKGMHNSAPRTDTHFPDEGIGIFQGITGMDHKGQVQPFGQLHLPFKDPSLSLLVSCHPVVVQTDFPQGNDLGMLEGLEKVLFRFLVVGASLCRMPAQGQIDFRVLVRQLYGLVNGWPVKAHHIVEGDPHLLGKI